MADHLKNIALGCLIISLCGCTTAQVQDVSVGQGDKCFSARLQMFKVIREANGRTVTGGVDARN